MPPPRHAVVRAGQTWAFEVRPRQGPHPVAKDKEKLTLKFQDGNRGEAVAVMLGMKASGSQELMGTGGVVDRLASILSDRQDDPSQGPWDNRCAEAVAYGCALLLNEPAHLADSSVFATARLAMLLGSKSKALPCTEAARKVVCAVNAKIIAAGGQLDQSVYNFALSGSWYYGLTVCDPSVAAVSDRWMEQSKLVGEEVYAASWGALLFRLEMVQVPPARRLALLEYMPTERMCFHAMRAVFKIVVRHRGLDGDRKSMAAAREQIARATDLLATVLGCDGGDDALPPAAVAEYLSSYPLDDWAGLYAESSHAVRRTYARGWRPQTYRAAMAVIFKYLANPERAAAVSPQRLPFVIVHFKNVYVPELHADALRLCRTLGSSSGAAAAASVAYAVAKIVHPQLRDETAAAVTHLLCVLTRGTYQARPGDALDVKTLATLDSINLHKVLAAIGILRLYHEAPGARRVVDAVFALLAMLPPCAKDWHISIPALVQAGWTGSPQFPAAMERLAPTCAALHDRFLLPLLTAVASAKNVDVVTLSAMCDVLIAHPRFTGSRKDINSLARHLRAHSIVHPGVEALCRRLALQARPSSDVALRASAV
eukprot:TRINITY_DN9484_c1_g2_i2.p1 TRINITY_DN9484_c1_g2~~TRINITY_DN9484_c1_g2_i2.p1  ORF type:complete len:612 (+),score=106.86 TRINITY_DN9484_c1_g2_i2:43-1836(+)